MSRIAALNDEGLELLNREEFPEALAKFAEAEPLCREMEDEESLQTCLGNTALVLKSTGDLDRALELTGEKEAICRRLELHAALVNALANKANILELLHRVEEAVAAGAEADQICRERGLDGMARQLKPLLDQLESHAVVEPSTTSDTESTGSDGVPRCYVCAEEGHTREMRIIEPGMMIDTGGWDKPWSPTQGCFQCTECGRLTCYTHSESSRLCACAATSWAEKSYLQKEFDNG